MLDGNSTILAHRLQNVALLLLSLAFLPLDTLILIISSFVTLFIPSQVQSHRSHAIQEASFRQHTILVTGVGMTKGLAIARLLYEAGYDVIGADFEPDGALVCGRVSRFLRRFYQLRGPTSKSQASSYIQSLLDIVTREKVDLWVSCSGVASAVEDGMAKEILEARISCKAIQFDVRTTQTLHEKHSFIQRTKNIGLNVPETHVITSHSEVAVLLRNSPIGRKYIMKTIGVDDSVRADMTLLPRASAVETAKHLAPLKISEQSPWILQQFIEGDEYCTHSLVVNGQVRAFVACRSSELLMHYEALPFQSPLSQAMLDFTKHYAAECGKDFTGHLSFDFMIEDEGALDPKNVVLYPIECNPRAHTAVALFNGTPAMVESYLAALEPVNDENNAPIIYPNRNDRYYWIGHDVVTCLILPTFSFLALTMPMSELLHNYRTFFTHLLIWKDGTFELWDPAPWWWLYHVYWPMRFLNCLLQEKKWSRLNVSTTKMFEC
jgi:predicted ATP-grasp superfamily ATP-dependent carboligase